MSGLTYMGVGRNLGYKKSFFLSKKGFSRFLKITGGDDDLFVNMYSTSRNTSVVLHPESVVLSEPKRTFRDFLIQKIRHISVSRFYKLKHKLIIGVFTLSKTLFWVLGFILIILYNNILWVGILFSIQLLVLLWTYYSFTKLLKVKYELWGLWFMDFMYISYSLLFSLRAFTAKKVKWS